MDLDGITTNFIQSIISSTSQERINDLCKRYQKQKEELQFKPTYSHNDDNNIYSQNSWGNEYQQQQNDYSYSSGNGNNNEYNNQSYQPYQSQVDYSTSNTTTSTEVEDELEEVGNEMVEYDDEEDTNQSKQIKSGIGYKLFLKHGGVEGKGMGKDLDGILNPLEAEQKLGRGGIGSAQPTSGDVPIPSFTPDQISELEERMFPADQKITWINAEKSSEYWEIEEQRILSSTLDGLSENLIVSSRIPERGNEICPPSLIAELEKQKNVLNTMDRPVFMAARRRANPYEDIRGAIFQNRAALKMANLDQLADLSMTGKHIYFADVCAGPGGFTEYLLYRKCGSGSKQQLGDKATGFGFTLEGDCDWKLDNFSRDSRIQFTCNPQSPGKVYRQNSQNFCQYQSGNWNFMIDYGKDNDGDILKRHNIHHFSKVVSQHTNGKGLDLFMADGGVSTEGDENNQEFLLQQLILCQFLMMFETLGTGGNFVCKIFDTFNPFTIGLLYFVYLQFESFTIVKPHTSRPLNSERYVVAKNKKPRNQVVIDYLHLINDKLNNGENVTEIVLIVDEQFKQFVYQTTKDICELQIEAFNHLFLCVHNKEISIGDHEKIKESCLQLWNIPNEARNAPNRPMRQYNNNRRDDSSPYSRPPNGQFSGGGRGRGRGGYGGGGGGGFGHHQQQQYQQTQEKNYDRYNVENISNFSESFSSSGSGSGAGGRGRTLKPPSSSRRNFNNNNTNNDGYNNNNYSSNPEPSIDINSEHFKMALEKHKAQNH